MLRFLLFLLIPFLLPAKIIHNGFVYESIKSAHTGKIWLDRNLGAKRVCESYDDELCYGDYFQWGRVADGHEKVNSFTTSSLSYSDIPNHSKFIKVSENPYDWRGKLNDKLWQGVDGKNNPCPSGYRVPTMSEIANETYNQNVKNRNDAFQSFLKLPSGGTRDGSGSFYDVGKWCNVWSSSLIYVKYIKNFGANSETADWYYDYRFYGYPVRCIKD